MRDASGIVCTNGAFPYSYWQRYLAEFSAIDVVARVRDDASGGAASSGSGVEFVDIPAYNGILGVLRSAVAIVHRTLSAVSDDSILLLRSPGTIGTLTAVACMCTGRPFAVEVVSDPWDVFAKGVTGRKSAVILRPLAAGALALACRRAAGAAYVTERTLQARYRPGKRTAVGSYVHAELPDAAFERRCRDTEAREMLRLVFVGSLAARYKGLGVLLQAMAEARKCGVEFELDVLGGGRHQAELEAQATALGLRERCFFRGQVPSGANVRSFLRSGDIFVLPSRTEGLPSALVEAMAVSLPCVASRVGGIPELLEPEYTFAAADWKALASILVQLAGDPERRREAGLRNYEEAQRFRNTRQAESLRAFFCETRRRFTSQ